MRKCRDYFRAFFGLEILGIFFVLLFREINLSVSIYISYIFITDLNNIQPIM